MFSFQHGVSRADLVLRQLLQSNHVEQLRTMRLELASQNTDTCGVHCLFLFALPMFCRFILFSHYGKHEISEKEFTTPQEPLATSSRREGLDCGVCDLFDFFRP
jgi:hypothetical protein